MPTDVETYAGKAGEQRVMLSVKSGGDTGCPSLSWVVNLANYAMRNHVKL